MRRRSHPGHTHAITMVPLVLALSCVNGRDQRGSTADGASTAAAPGAGLHADSGGRSTLTGEFRAIGNEPGWMLGITDSVTTLRWDYDERRASAPTPPAEAIPGGRRFAVQGGTPFTVAVRDTLCADGMSGRQFPARVQVTIGERTLDGCGGEPAELLQGDVWEVDSLNGSPVVDGSRITLSFGNDGRLTGSASCNSYATTYTLGVEGVTLEAAMTTRRACTPEIDRQEVAFLALLRGVVPYRVTDGGMLVLGEGEGRRIVATRR